MPAAPIPSLTLAPSSSAESGGDNLFDAPFQVTFGNKVAAEGGSASGGAGGSIITGLIKDAAMGIGVALAARWLWGQIK